MTRMNPLDENHLAVLRSEVVSTALALGSHNLPFLQGVRKLVTLGFEVSRGHHDPDFMLFVGIASEADHIPHVEAQSLCAESWLAQCENDARELERFYGQQVAAACKQLIERFSSVA